jgi:hypothetical protein
MTSFSFPSSYEQLLERHVDSKGRVNYDGWKSDPLSTTLQQELQTHPKPQEDTSYWINTYNALTIQAVLEHYPINSIQDIAKGKVWTTKKFHLSHGVYTLDQIENAILRPRNDARIHAALNCASIGCPPLWNKPFTKENLHQQLEESTNRWLSQNAYTNSNGETQLSKIFLWYGEDFRPDPIQFLKRYRPQESWPSFDTITYMEYDWSLNKQ